MANHSARKRIEMGIARIERTGWTTGTLRWDGSDIAAKDAKVCLVGSLITDKEYKELTSLPTVPGICSATEVIAEAIGDVIGTVAQCDSRISRLISWNDRLTRQTGKRQVLRVLRKSLKILNAQKGKKA